jgi:HAD superfamily phosphoserine phosphatase-like hydrolase
VSWAGSTTSRRTRIESPAALRIVYVDFDGTLVSTNMIHYLVHSCAEACRASGRLGPALRGAGVIASLPLLYLLDRRGARVRDAFFHRHYRGIREARFRRLLDAYWKNNAARLTCQAVLERVRWLAADGYLPVIVSGSVRPVVEAWRSLHPLFRAALCTDLEVDSRGVFTGRAAGEIVVEDRKVAAIEDYERSSGHAVAERICIADSIQDVPMLSLATRAIVANPSRALAREARRRSWEVLRGA